MSDFEKLREYLQKAGRRGAATISLLGKLSGFVEAMQTDIGKELLSTDISRHDELLNKMYTDEITEAERAELRYLKLRIQKVSEKINLYYAKLKEVKGE